MIQRVQVFKIHEWEKSSNSKPARAVTLYTVLSLQSASQFPTLRDDNGQLGLAVCSDGHVLNLTYRQHAVDDLHGDVWAR